MLTAWVILNTFICGVMGMWWSANGFGNCVFKMMWVTVCALGAYQIFTNPAIQFVGQ